MKDTFTAAQNLKGSSGNTHETYTNKSYNLTATTGLGDWVNYVNDSSFNIWVYPVIGQTVCPDEKPNCQPSEQVPLTLQFSAPNFDAQPEAVLDTNLQWYQPPWEPGNILSYPANLQQLQSMYTNIACDGPTMNCLTQLTTDTDFVTDNSEVTQKTTWSVGTKDTPSTSFNQNYSFENDFSANGSFGVPLAHFNYGVDIDVSGSFGFSSLSKHTTTLGQSTGIEIAKPGTFPVPQNYGYSVAPYIMGTTKPGGVVDNQQLSGDVQTFGLLRAMFTADPLTTTSGGWWSQAYRKAPDVALNHPSRWQIVPEPLTSSPPSNCIPTGDQSKPMDCAHLNPRYPDNPWTSVFDHMRGFFIMSASSQGHGPQLQQAKAGDVLNLQTRVYNYSLAPMSNNTEVHVRFYFMPWYTPNNVPAGNSVLISEEKVSPIPPFDDSSNVPNWVLVPTTFDTSKFDETKDGNLSVVFWVVVWMQDQQGNMIGEMPGHGLTAIPKTLTSLDQANNIEESYSNNVGFYKQLFFIASPGVVPGPLPGPSSINIGKLNVSADRITPRDNVILSATLVDSGGAASGVNVNFYDGDPRHGGQLFDVERIPHVGASQPQKVQASFRTNTCGVHHLFAVVNAGTPSEVDRRAEPVHVVCSANK